MKKLIALVAALLGAASLFAEKTLHLGMYVPITPLTLVSTDADADGSENLSTVGFGASVDYTHVTASGFTWKLNAGVAKLHIDDVFGSAFDDGLDAYGGFGLGYSFIRTEKMTLTVTEGLGIRGLRLDDNHGRGFGEDIYKNGVNIGTEYKYMGIMLFYLADEVNVTYRFTDHVGVFASFGLFYSIGTGELRDKIHIHGEYHTLYGDGDSTTIKGICYGITFEPKFGVSWTF